MFKKSFILLAIIVFGLGACVKATPVPPTPTPTQNLAATEAAQAAANAQATGDAEKAQQTQSVQATLDAQASQVAQATQNAVATSTQKALNAQATTTQFAIRKITSTAEAAAEATEQARPVFEWVQKLFTEGVTTSTEGKFSSIPDFNQSAAQLGSGLYWKSGFAANNFVLAADITITSASNSANWQDSSCGFVFGEENDRSYNLADVAMDGYVYMWGCRGGSCVIMAAKKYGPPINPKGEMQIALMVFDNHIHFYVNGAEIVSAADLRYKEGDIAYLIRSGTNKDFGTRCEMTNIGLWKYP